MRAIVTPLRDELLAIVELARGPLAETRTKLYATAYDEPAFRKHEHDLELLTAEGSRRTLALSAAIDDALGRRLTLAPEVTAWLERIDSVIANLLTAVSADSPAFCACALGFVLVHLEQVDADLAAAGGAAA